MNRCLLAVFDTVSLTLSVCPGLSPVCGQRVGRGLVPEARGGGGGFLRHHLRHARGDQHGSRQSPETRRPEENLQSCKKSSSVLFLDLKMWWCLCPPSLTHLHPAE